MQREQARDMQLVQSIRKIMLGYGIPGGYHHYLAEEGVRGLRLKGNPLA